MDKTSQHQLGIREYIFLFLTEIFRISKFIVKIFQMLELRIVFYFGKLFLEHQFFYYCVTVRNGFA